MLCDVGASCDSIVRAVPRDGVAVWLSLVPADLQALTRVLDRRAGSPPDRIETWIHRYALRQSKSFIPGPLVFQPLHCEKAASAGSRLTAILECETIIQGGMKDDHVQPGELNDVIDACSERNAGDFES